MLLTGDYLTLDAMQVLCRDAGYLTLDEMRAIKNSEGELMSPRVCMRSPCSLDQRTQGRT